MVKLLTGFVGALAINMVVLTFALPPRSIAIERPFRVVEAEVTMYNAVLSQTDSDPDIVASGKKAREGMAACPSWLEFGTQIEIEGKKWTCEDRMAKRYRHGNYLDLLVDSYEEAKQFGRQKLLAKIYD